MHIFLVCLLLFLHTIYSKLFLVEVNESDFSSRDTSIGRDFSIGKDASHLLTTQNKRRLSRSVRCNLKKKTGPCRKSIPSWYFKRGSGCLAFTYGGCHGNANRFHSKTKCESICKGRVSSRFSCKGKIDGSYCSLWAPNNLLQLRTNCCDEECMPYVCSHRPACITFGGRVPRQPCVFPFKFKGVTYTHCAKRTWSQPWCSVATDSDGNHIPGQWGLCSSSCVPL